MAAQAAIHATFNKRSVASQPLNSMTIAPI